MATRPKAWRHPQCVATIPPLAMPWALPSGIEMFQMPIICERFSCGYMPAIMAVPPGA